MHCIQGFQPPICKVAELLGLEFHDAQVDKSSKPDRVHCEASLVGSSNCGDKFGVGTLEPFCDIRATVATGDSGYAAELKVGT